LRLGRAEVEALFGTPTLGDAFRRPLLCSVPTLFLSGTLDANTPPYQAEEMRWGFTDSVHLVQANGGHEDWMRNPNAAGAATKTLVAVGASRRPERGPARFVAGGFQGRSVMATETSIPKEVALRTRAPCEDPRPLQPKVAPVLRAFLAGEPVAGRDVDLPPLRFVPLEGPPGEVAHPAVKR